MLLAAVVSVIFFSTITFHFINVSSENNAYEKSDHTEINIQAI